MFIKTAAYENDIGRIVCKKCGPLYMTSIDMTGNTVSDDSEELLGAAGSVSTGLRYRTKNIPATFQFADIGSGYDRDFISAVLSPMLYGVLTVNTENDVYRISCRPEEKPVFKRSDKVDYLFDFAVDFRANFPYWRKGLFERTLSPGNGLHTIKSKTVNNTPICIEYSANQGGMFSLNGKSFNVSTDHTQKIIIDTNTLTVTNADGTLNNNVIIGYATIPMDKVVMNYGNNTLIVSEGNPLIRWWELSEGTF